MIHLVVKNDKGDDRWINITGSQLKSLRQVSSLESVLTGIGRGADARAMAGEYHREEAPRYRNDRRLYRAKI